MRLGSMSSEHFTYHALSTPTLMYQMTEQRLIFSEAKMVNMFGVLESKTEYALLQYITRLSIF